MTSVVPLKSVMVAFVMDTRVKLQLTSGGTSDTSNGDATRACVLANVTCERDNGRQPTSAALPGGGSVVAAETGTVDKAKLYHTNDCVKEVARSSNVEDAITVILKTSAMRTGREAFVKE